MAQVSKQKTGFVQKHENEIPGLFQDNSRTFFSFQGLNFIDFQSIFDCFCRKRRSGNRSSHFYQQNIFIVVLINTGTTGKLNRSTVPPSLFNESSAFQTVFFLASRKSKRMEKNRCILLFQGQFHIFKGNFTKFQDNSRTNGTILKFQEFSRTKVKFKDFSRSVRTLEKHAQTISTLIRLIWIYTASSST